MNKWLLLFTCTHFAELQSLLFAVCSSAEHRLSDTMSEAGQRGVGAQVFLSGSFTEKE